MRIANVAGRATIVDGDRAIDIAVASDGRFGPDPQQLLADWDAFLEAAPELTGPAEPFDAVLLQNPVGVPGQVFAIGLNYRTHAEESGMAVPSVPATFTKFPSSLSGPHDEIPVVGTTVDWEVELVAVIGRRADHVSEADAWSHVAGLTIGQDISDRTLQFAAGNQFSLGKSRRGYGPMGPWLVTLDEFDDAGDLGLGCSVNDEVVQDARTSDLIFSVPQIISELSAVLTLMPGDVIFTGTPSGVGMARKPPRALAAGDVLHTWIEGIGTITNRCT